MEYRNTKTGVVINVDSKIKGGDWEPVAPVSAKIEKPVADTPKKRTKK